jgi:hypothetical protein
MAQDKEQFPCLRAGCTDVATKHVIINTPPKPPVKIAGGIGLPIPGTHADLCDLHLTELRKHFGVVQESESGSCNEECPLKKPKKRT